MKRSLALKRTVGALLFAAFVATSVAYAQAGYNYYYSDPFSSIDTSKWTQNGTLATASGTGIYNNDSVGGALIFKPAIPDGASDYEVKATLAIGANGGSFVVYLRASPGSLLQGGNPGNLGMHLTHVPPTGSMKDHGGLPS